jgi:hypothetical protein
MATYTDCHPNAVAFGPVQVTAKSKSATCLFDGAPLKAILATPQAPLRVPFEWSSFDDPGASRVTLCVEVDAELQSWVEHVEGLAVLAMAQCGEAFFKRPIKLEDSQRMFCSALRTSNGTLLKLKANRSGPNALRCWTAAGESVPEVPAQVRNSFVAPAVEVRHVWANAGQWGLVWSATDAIFAAPQRTFPWKM